MNLIDKNIKLFMIRFNCACKRIMKNGVTIYSTLRSNPTKSLIDQSFRLPPHRRYGLRIVLAAITHPFDLLILDRKSITGRPWTDLEKYLNLQVGCLDVFLQGFGDYRNYTDSWGYRSAVGAYHYSLMFNLGRAFLQKYCAVKLPYKLPPEYQTYFDQLN